MVETGNKEPVGDIAIVEKEETLSQAEITASNERIKLMDQLQRKLKTKKTMVTKNLKKVETAIDAFQKVGAEGETARVIKMEAEEVVTSVEKLKESKAELESVSTSLQDVICESDPSELKGISPDDAITKVEEDVELYLEKVKLILKENRKPIAEALEKNSQIITTNVASTPAEQHKQQKDKFQSVSELKPKFLEKDANLLEVKNWIQQIKNYLDAGYKDSPPKKDASVTSYMDNLPTKH